MRTGSFAIAFALLFAAACGSEPTGPSFSSTGNPGGTGGIGGTGGTGGTGGGGSTLVGAIDTATSSANLGAKTTGFVDKTLVDGGVTYKYKVFVPSNYNSVSKVPVLLAMHASSEKGSDNLVQTTTGVGRVIRASPSTFPALTVFPQAPNTEGTTFQAFIRISQIALSQTLNEYGKRDMSRVYLTGHSYGGLVGYAVANNSPDVFAAFLPISAYVCGACIFGTGTQDLPATSTIAAKIKTMPIDQFQGDQDSQVSVTTVRAEVDILKAAGSPILYNEIKGGDHAIWDGIYAKQSTWDWLWAQHK